jgi:hypothetical protein
MRAAAGDATITIAWAAPSSTGSAPIAGYRISFAPAGGTWRSVDVPAGARSRVFSLLRNGTTYYFRMLAFSAAGQSPSTPSLASVPRTAPSVPRSLAVTPGNARVTVRWTAPATNGGAPILGYSLFYAASGGSWQRVSFSPRMSYTVTGLRNGVAYYFRIAAYNAAGSSPSTASVRAIPRTVPSAPALRATPGDRRVSLAWTAPASTGGAAITRYVLQRSTSPTAGWVTLSATVAPTARSFTASGLTNRTRYYFRIAAVNAAGSGPWSAVVSAVPVAPLPPPPPPPPPSGCSPSYPTVCIPPAPPDLDCGDIPYRRFTVLPPDPHHFDLDFDGVGCES